MIRLSKMFHPKRPTDSFGEMFEEKIIRPLDQASQGAVRAAHSCRDAPLPRPGDVVVISTVILRRASLNWPVALA
jgi:hypothetical protein